MQIQDTNRDNYDNRMNIFTLSVKLTEEDMPIENVYYVTIENVHQ